MSKKRLLRITTGNFDQINQKVVTNKDGSLTIGSKTDAPTTINLPMIVPTQKPTQNEDDPS